MGVLEQITQMKSQGVADEEIITKLQEQGISPKAINDALSQAQIKNAVSSGAGEMQPPITDQAPPAPQNPVGYVPKTQEISDPSQMSEEGQEMYTPSPQESSQPQGFYQQESYDDYSGTGGADATIEIAEQVFSEKMKSVQKKLGDINEFKTLTQTKVDDIANRLKRIETTIDKLQIAILEKVGSYGSDLGSIKKEMAMMQDSFGKVVNKAVRGHKAHVTHKSHPRKKTSKKK
jgi:hypothetical protein